MKKYLLILAILSSISLFANNNENLNMREKISIKDEILNELKNTANENYEKSEEITRNDIIIKAKEFLNKPYKWGNVGPSSFDCSGFVLYIYSNYANISLPRVSKDQSLYNQKKKLDEIKIGDLLFFNTSSKGKVINHVGIYIGDGKFIHASSAKKKVVISSINEGFYKKVFKWAISPFKGDII